MPEHELGPVRALGWLREDRAAAECQIARARHLALNARDRYLPLAQRKAGLCRGRCGGDGHWTVRPVNLKLLHATTQISF